MLNITLQYKPPKKEPEEAVKGKTLYADKSVRNQYLQLGGDNDTYSYTNTMTGQDIIDDSSGEADRLLFGKKSLSEAKLQAQDDDDADNKIDSLLIDFGKGNSVTIYHYFNNTSRSIKASEPGPGLIETISFSNKRPLHIENIKSLLKEGEIGKAISPSIRIWNVHQPVPIGNRQNEWQKQVFCKIKNAWNLPDGSKSPQITLYINHLGALSGIRLLKSSGDKLLDDVALVKVKAAAPFKAPPSRKAQVLVFKYIPTSEIECPIIYESSRIPRRRASKSSTIMPSNPMPSFTKKVIPNQALMPQENRTGELTLQNCNAVSAETGRLLSTIGIRVLLLFFVLVVMDACSV